MNKKGRGDQEAFRVNILYIGRGDKIEEWVGVGRWWEGKEGADLKGVRNRKRQKGRK